MYTSQLPTLLEPDQAQTGSNQQAKEQGMSGVRGQPIPFNLLQPDMQQHEILLPALVRYYFEKPGWHATAVAVWNINVQIMSLVRTANLPSATTARPILLFGFPIQIATSQFHGCAVISDVFSNIICQVVYLMHALWTTHHIWACNHSSETSWFVSDAIYPTN